jgi:hypothetical protein
MRSILLAFALVCAVISPAVCQENITITTYFPSPYGMYSDLNVHNKVVVHDSAGGVENANLTADANGNLVVQGSDVFQQLIFADSGRPFSYLQAYTSTSGFTYCANGYVAASYLDAVKVPLDPDAMAPSGYIVCIRSWE